MSEAFNKGDVVQLKSGGPHMTVESVGEDPYEGGPAVYCTFFDDKKERKHEFFGPETLKRVG